MKFLIILSMLVGNLFSFDVEKIRKIAKKNISTINLNKTLDKNLYAKEKDMKKEVSELNKENITFYLFTSSSVSIDYLNSFIEDASSLSEEFNVNIQLVYQGITSKAHEEEIINLVKHFKAKENSMKYLRVINRMIDPYIFKKHNINKVPVMGLAKTTGNQYPSKNTLEYIARGKIKILNFLELIKEEDTDYEIYYNFIANY